MRRIVRAARASLWTLVFPLVACRTGISLSDPDGGDGAPPTCLGPKGARDVVANLDAPFGSPLAILPDGDRLYVVTNTLYLLRVALTPGSPVQIIGGAGCPPKAFATDDAYLYETCPDTAQVARVAKNGTTTTLIPDQSNAAGIAADGHGAAYWTIASSDGSMRMANFSGALPVDYPAAPPLARAMLYNGDRLYVSGDRELLAFDLANPGAPALVAQRCDGQLLTLGGTSLLCTEDDTIVRVRTDTPEATVIATLPGSARELVVGGGRAFVRIERYANRPGPSNVMSIPLDGVGGPTFLPIPPNAQSLASDACSLYYATDRTIERWGF